MDKKKRIEYLATTMCVLFTGFIIYGLVGSMGPIIDNSKSKSFLLFGLIGGIGFSAIVSTIILTVRFFAKRKLGFKIVAALLWPLTFACSIYVGFICYIPYQIYNLVKIITYPLPDEIDAIARANQNTNTNEIVSHEDINGIK